MNGINRSKENRKFLLVMGSIHSGQTLIAAILGRHPEINMLNECLNGDNFKLIGKLYCGNKIGIRQIGFKLKSNFFGHILNRITSLNNNINFRLYPTMKHSLSYYDSLGTKFILIERNDRAMIRSLMERQNFPYWFAKIHIAKINEKANKMKKNFDVHVVRFEELVKSPESVIRDICRFLNLEYCERMLEGPRFNYVYPNNGFLESKIHD